MTDEAKITIDDMLQPSDPSRIATPAMDRYFADALFGARPSRRRFDPRRITDRMRKPATPVTGGAVVYGALAAGEAIDRMAAVPVDIAAHVGYDPLSAVEQSGSSPGS